jgi:hypothetical protein
MRSPQLFALFLGLSILSGISTTAVTANPLIAELKQTSSSTSGQKISDADIQTMIKSIKTAIKDKNAAAIVSYYAPFIVSELTIKTDSSTEVFELDGLTENKRFLEESFKGVKSAETLSENWDVEVLATDEMAIIRRERVVNITATDGKRYIVESEAVAKVAPIDGKLKIISIQETAEVGIRPN